MARQILAPWDRFDTEEVAWHDAAGDAVWWPDAGVMHLRPPPVVHVPSTTGLGAEVARIRVPSLPALRRLTLPHTEAVHRIELALHDVPDLEQLTVGWDSALGAGPAEVGLWFTGEPPRQLRIDGDFGTLLIRHKGQWETAGDARTPDGRFAPAFIGALPEHGDTAFGVQVLLPGSPRPIAPQDAPTAPQLLLLGARDRELHRSPGAGGTLRIVDAPRLEQVWTRAGEVTLSRCPSLAKVRGVIEHLDIRGSTASKLKLYGAIGVATVSHGPTRELDARGVMARLHMPIGTPRVIATVVGEVHAPDAFMVRDAYDLRGWALGPRGPRDRWSVLAQALDAIRGPSDPEASARPRGLRHLARAAPRLPGLPPRGVWRARCAWMASHGRWWSPEAALDTPDDWPAEDGADDLELWFHLRSQSDWEGPNLPRLAARSHLPNAARVLADFLARRLDRGLSLDHPDLALAMKELLATLEGPGRMHAIARIRQHRGLPEAVGFARAARSLARLHQRLPAGPAIELLEAFVAWTLPGAGLEQIACLLPFAALDPAVARPHLTELAADPSQPAADRHAALLALMSPPTPRPEAM